MVFVVFAVMCRCEIDGRRKKNQTTPMAAVAAAKQNQTAAQIHCDTCAGTRAHIRTNRHTKTLSRSHNTVDNIS